METDRTSRRPALRRIALQVALWWVAGAATVLALSACRDAVRDLSIPYSRKIDLAKDVAWVNRHVPQAALDAVSGGRDDVGWRMDGRQSLQSRIGEESTVFQLWRTLGDGTVERGEPTTSVMAWRVRRGWPLLCVEGAEWTAGTGPSFADRMIVIRSSSGQGAAIPLGIMPLPLLVDGAVFGAVIAALVRVPGMVERALRRQRGVCPRCAYPLRGASTCPECGPSAGGSA